MRIPPPSSIPAQRVNYFSAWRALVAVSLLLCFSGLSAAQTPTPQTGGQKAPANQAQAAAPKANQQATSAPQQSAEEEDFLLRRARWFYQQRAYPLGFIPRNARLDALKEMDAMIEYERKIGLLPPEGAVTPVFPGPTVTWGSIGPSPENNASGNGFFGTPTDSGRVAAIAVDPTNANIVYVGGAQGGVWKSTDAGVHFTALTDSQPSLAVGSIAIAPSSPSTIYVGTGEQDFVSIDPTTGGDNYYGAGVLVSTDGGNTWTQRAGPFVGPFNNQIGGARIPAIAVHPTNPNIVLAGVVFSNSGGSDAGLYRSVDGGANWTQILTASGAIGTAVVFDPSNGNNVYVALGRTRGSSNNGVYKSTDGGVTFTKLAGGLPTTNVGRIELGIAASAPTTVYASVADSSTGSRTLLGLFRSMDGGTSWTQVVNGSTFDYCTPQCFYSHAIGVSPVNSSLVIAGGTAGAGPGTSIGQTVFRSTDGGMTWTDIHVGASSTQLHSDQHAFRFSADGSKLYVGNDGGAWRSDNPTAAVGTLDWVNLNGTLTLAQFYPGLGVDASNGNAALGGTQDNGTIKYSGNPIWDQVGCGDGAWNIVDNQVPSTVYALCTSGNSPYINKSLFAGAVGTFFGIISGINLADRIEFIPAIVLDPSNNQILYTPTHRVYQSTNGGASWTPISPDLTMDGVSSVAVVAVAKSDSNTVYASTDDGRIWRTINALSGAGAMWTNLNTPDLPNRFITRIGVDRTNRDVVYLTYSGFRFPPGDTKGHVFKSTNGGTTWVDISGNLPNVPVNDIVVDPDLANALYIGTDIGVFQTLDGGTTWTTLGTGLPRVAVHSLTGRRESRVLYAGTHGRGVWIFQLTNVAVPAGPFLASISPSSQPAGAATFTLTADGDHFLSTSSKVQWDGSQTGVTTSFVSVNQLTAMIDTSLLTAGVHQVSVFDATQTPNTSSSLRFAVTNPAPSITSLSPSGASAGGAAFTLTVNGLNFNCSAGANASVVNFGTTV
ncbi:MAG TPA: IPT/TIG domain-containing protein, partial [Candidatus Acidoferrales bacterium]|nr:IPT/TIG domain-containing protein [Candidatus Acidoferrales bacterium]